MGHEKREGTREKQVIWNASTTWVMNNLSSEAAPAVQTRLQTTPVLIDLEGNFIFIENKLNTTRDLDFTFVRLNNHGEIAATIIEFHEDGTYVEYAMLLIPDNAGHYNIVELGLGYQVFSMNDFGDVVVWELPGGDDVGDDFTLLFRGGVPVDLSHFWIASGRRFRMNNQAQFLAGSLDLNSFGGIVARYEADGTMTPLQDIPGIAPTTLGTIEAARGTDINDYGTVVGAQAILQGKGKNATRKYQPVIYDNQGTPSFLDAPASVELRINNQLVMGQPTVSGVSSGNSDSSRDLWIKFPGYTGTYVVDLMDDIDRAHWVELGYADDNGTHTYQLLTPRTPSGSVDHNARPMLIGSIRDHLNQRGGDGVFILRPVPTQ